MTVSTYTAGKEDQPMEAKKDNMVYVPPGIVEPDRAPKPKRKVTPKPLVQVARELGNAKAELEGVDAHIDRLQAKSKSLAEKRPKLLERITKAAAALAAATK